MSTYGEKHINTETTATHVQRFAEWRVFDWDVKELLDDINDYVTDDWEDFQRNDVYFGLDEEYSTCNADMLLEWVEEIIKERVSDEMEDEEIEWLRKWTEPLKQAEGFTLHIKWTPEWAKKVCK